MLRRRTLALVLSAAGLLSLAGLAPLYSELPTLNRPKPFALPEGFDHTVGLLSEGDHLISIDWMNDRIFAIDSRDGSLMWDESFPNPFTTGLNRGPGCLLSVDGFHRKVYKHDPKTFKVIGTFTVPVDGPSSVAWAEQALWLADRESGSLHRYKGSRHVQHARYELEEQDPAALFESGGLLWVMDGTRKTIRRYRFQPRFEPVESVDLSSFLADGARPTGMALAGSQLWLMTNHPSLLYQFPIDEIWWQASAGAAELPKTAPKHKVRHSVPAKNR